MKANKFIKIRHFKTSLVIEKIFIASSLLIGIYYFCTENFRIIRVYEYEDIEYIGWHNDCIWFFILAVLWLIQYKYLTPRYYRNMYGITDEDLDLYEQESFIDD